MESAHHDISTLHKSNHGNPSFDAKDLKPIKETNEKSGFLQREYKIVVNGEFKKLQNGNGKNSGYKKNFHGYP